MMEKKIRLSLWDVEELAAQICGVDLDELDNDDIDSVFYNKFDVEIEVFHKIVEHLLPMIDVGVTMAGRTVKGFAKDGCMIVKVEV